MGFDCTLHVVDEEALREQFVAKILGERDDPTPLDDQRPDAAELWADAHEALANDPPRELANYLCNLALVFSACSQPYAVERGFALSLWPWRMPDELNDRGDVGKIYFPKSGEFIALTPELLGNDNWSALQWSEATGKLFALEYGRVVAVPLALLEQLEREQG